MKANDIIRMAHDIIDSCAIENDYIEYKKSADIKDGILKTACAFSNNYMNREIRDFQISVKNLSFSRSLLTSISHRN
jgi:hypothetical protein